MPKPDDDRPQPELPPFRPPTLPPDFPDMPQNPSSELQPPSDPSATPDKVSGTTPAPADQERRIGLEKRRAGRIVSR
jgi:hypothetical protein